MKLKSSSVYSDVQQDFIHRRLMQTISERIKKVDEIDKQNAQMTKRIQQSESSINFQKSASDYKKYSELLKVSQKNRMASHMKLKTMTCNGVSENDKKFNTFYSLKRTKTCEDLFEDDNEVQGTGLNNHIMPRVLSTAEHVDPTQFLQLRPNTCALSKRSKRSITEGHSMKFKQDNKIVLQNLEECQQRLYLDKLADAIFNEQISENTPKYLDKKSNKTSQVEKIIEKNREIQQSDFNFEIMKAMNQVIIRGKVTLEGGPKKKYFIKTFEKNYFLRILLRYMTEQQQLFLFDGILQQDTAAPFSEASSETKQSHLDTEESSEEEGSVTKESLKNDILTKFINDIDIENEKIIIKSLNPQSEQKPQNLRSRSQDTKLNFHLKKNRNEIVKEEALQSYLAGKFRKLRTSLYSNLDSSLKKDSSPSTNKNFSEMQETTDEIKQDIPKAKIYTPSSFTNALQRKSQQNELTNEEISKQNEEIDKSLNFFKNSKLSQYFNLYTEPDQIVEKSIEIPEVPAKSQTNKLHSNFRNSVQSEKVVTESSPVRKKHYSYDFNNTLPIHSIQEKRGIKLVKISSKTQLVNPEVCQTEESKNGINTQVIDSSQLDKKEQTIQIKRSSSGSQKVKLFIMLQNKQKIKAKYYDQEEDKGEKAKMSSLLNKKNLSTQGQLLQNFLISKQQASKNPSESKQSNNSPQKMSLQHSQQQTQQPNQQNNSATIRNILSDKQKIKSN